MRKSALAALTAAAVLAAPAVAQAHVTLNPREVTAGSFTVMNVRVPNERDDAGTTKVDVRFPDGFYSVLYKKVPGWKVKVYKEKLDKPVEREGGLKVTEQVSRIVWTGNPKKGGIVRPGQFEEFPISTQVPEGEAGSFLTFKAYQTYRDGERVRWTGAPEVRAPRAAREAARALDARIGPGRSGAARPGTAFRRAGWRRRRSSTAPTARTGRTAVRRSRRRAGRPAGRR